MKSQKVKLMKKEIIILPAFYIVGLGTRTNNHNEITGENAKIGHLLSRYHGDNISAKIVNKLNSGTILHVYTEYEDKHFKDYTFIIGQQVSSDVISESDLRLKKIPEQTYAKFTTEAGSMPMVCINAWQQIWEMTDEELGGTRSYTADFELYDERAINPESSVLDIYIAIDR